MNLCRLVPLVALIVLVPLLRAQDDDDPKKKKAGTIPEGLKALQHPDPKVRYRAADTLAQLGPLAKFAVPELKEALKDKHPMVRVKVAEALWKIDQTPAGTLMPVLLQALKEREPSARAAAPPVIALLGAKAKLAVPALVNALADKEFSVKVAAVTALGDLGPVAKESANDLLDLTKDKENFFLLEPFVGAALANLGQGALPALTKALTDSSFDRRRVAAYALGSMGAAAAPAANELAIAMQSKDPGTRRAAASALGKIGPAAKSTLAQLEIALADKDPSVRIEAALATWFVSKDSRHITVLVKALSNESVGVRDYACQAIGVMKAGGKDAVDPVAKLLGDKDLRVRAIMTLGEIGPAAAKTTPQLKQLLKDKDGGAQLAAAFSLWQITGDAKETLAAMTQTLSTEAYYTPTIVLLGDMGPAAEPMLQTLVNLYREEDVPADRKALAEAIKKIDSKVAMKLGIK
ncbi:MAG: HEAT repeat domain-containing protein [Gemmataceae bacterium]|nr:HEAT repeat domain-containing protein [Gemmataceae bacterium]